MAERRGSERGSTTVEFLGVALLVIGALLAVAQMAVWVWARNVAMHAVHEGARVAAEAGRPVDDGTAMARALLHDALGGSAQRFAVDATTDSGAIVVAAQGDAPAIVPFMPRFTITVRGRAFDEDGVLP